MNKHTDFFDNVEKVSNNLVSVFERMQEIPGMFDHTCEEKMKICQEIPEQVRSRVVKIAVVGAIKSGKSTFVNALLDQDFLKRGAGSVTAIITRLRQGDQFKAEIFLKSWDEINKEIENALVFFPEVKKICPEMEGLRFDLRRKNDRIILKRANDRLWSDISLNGRGIRAESKIVSHALEGYDFARDYVQADPVSISFTGEEFEQHKIFTGTDAIGFFVKDVLIEAAAEKIGPQTEIADCQGSDSTNPMHMAQIQNYLFSASMIIYLISSRTGLREADIRFLTIIQKMGLLNRILFVVNCDFSEHDNLNDLVNVESAIRKELCYFTPDPELFTFSSLYVLFCKCRKSLSPKNAMRLAQWAEEPELVGYSENMKQDFHQRLDRILIDERHDLLMAGPVVHVKKIVDFAEERTKIYQQLKQKDLTKAVETIDSLSDMHNRTRQFKSIVKNAMESAVKGLNSEISADIKAFFNKSNNSPVRKMQDFVNNYPVTHEKYENEIHFSGFHNAFYFMFQDLKKEVETFVVEVLNPEIAGFIAREEEKIAAYFDSVFYSYNNIDPLSLCPDFPESAKAFERKYNGKNRNNFISIESVRRILGLKFPGIVSSIDYNAGVRLDSMARFGFHSLTLIMSKILSKNSTAPGSAALRDTGIKIKKQALKTLENELLKCKNELRDTYLFVLIEAVARDFQEKIMTRFQENDFEIEAVQKLIDADQREKKEQADALEMIKSMVRDTSRRIDTLMIP
ncbi:MAG: dynamin family protein [Desulfobacteraceae bacterium]